MMPFRRGPKRRRVPTPTGTGDRIIDEVASESLVSTHPDVLWYPDFTNISTVGNSWRYYSLNFPAYGMTPGYAFGSSWAGYGSAPYLRLKSQKVGDVTAGNGEDVLNWRQWVNSSTWATYGSGMVPQTWSGPAGITSGPLTEIYFRMMFELENVAGMSNAAAKLGGFESTSDYALDHLWRSPNSGPTPLEFMTYWFSTPLGWSGSNFVSQPPPTCDVGVVHSYEVHVKLNTRSGSPGNYTYASDGQVRLWFNNVLVVDKNNIKLSEGTQDNWEITVIQGLCYLGGASGPPNDYCYIKYGGYCVATRRIGPGKAS